MAQMFLSVGVWLQSSCGCPLAMGPLSGTASGSLDVTTGVKLERLSRLRLRLSPKVHAPPGLLQP